MLVESDGVDVKESSLRKEERLGHSEAAVSMFFTGIRVSFVYHLSVFLVEETYLLFSWLRQRKEKKEVKLLGMKPSKKNASTSFGKKSLRNLIVCVLAIRKESEQVWEHICIRVRVRWWEVACVEQWHIFFSVLFVEGKEMVDRWEKVRMR